MSFDFSQIMDHAFRALDKGVTKVPQLQPEHGPCDICEERPGDRVIKVSGLCVCDQCDDEHHARALRFHTDDDAAAHEAGVRARGEI